MDHQPIQAVFPPGGKVWDSDLLDHMRGEGDPPADDLVDQMLKANEGDPEQTARVLLRQLLGGGHYNMLLGTPGADLLSAFLREHGRLPPWANPELIEHAQQLGRRHMVVGSVLLAVASLPECYLDAQGTPILTSTGQLSEQPTRRLRHTAHMVFSVCAPDSIVAAADADPHAVPVGLSKAITVRLMHALIRRFTADGYRLPERFYRSVEEELGLPFDDDRPPPTPINQEDQAYVLLTFSYVVLQGLERMGVELSERDRHAYVHLWNVIGHVMGVQRELMPDTYREAASLFHALKQRLAAPSEQGTALMAAMLTWINKMVPRPLRGLDLAAELVIRFVGAESAAMLGIEQRGVRWLRHRLFTLPLDGYEAFKPAGTQWSPLGAVVEMMAGPMVRAFMAEVHGTRPPPPAHLLRPAAERPPVPPDDAWPEYVVQTYGNARA